MSNNTGESGRVFGLDIFRAAAIILVVLEHGAFLLRDTRLRAFPFFEMIDGVDLFFVLSGFLIGSILLKEINSAKTFGLKALAAFWKRRWWRTLPNYYLILLANYVVVYYGIIREDIHQFNWKFFFFLQNFSKPFHGFFWESWSLTIEEWFYISAPLLLLFCLKFLTPKRSFIIVTVLMMVLPLCYRAWIADPATDNEYLLDIHFRKVVLTRLDSIAYGLLASWVYYYFERFWTTIRIVSFITGLALIIFVTKFDAPSSSFYQQVFYFSLSPFAAMLLLPFMHRIKKGKGIVAAAITHISKISYSMYLVNWALIGEVIRDNFPPTSDADGLIKYIAYWLIVIVASTLLFRYFERPMMNLRDR